MTDGGGGSERGQYNKRGSIRSPVIPAIPELQYDGTSRIRMRIMNQPGGSALHAEISPSRAALYRTTIALPSWLYLSMPCHLARESVYEEALYLMFSDNLIS